MNSFPVNFTKDGFAWSGGLEEELIDHLAPLTSGYRLFAKNLRVRPKGGGVTAVDFARAVEEVQEGVNEPGFRTDAAKLAMPMPR